MSNIYSKVGRFIEKKRLTKDELVPVVGVSRPTLYNYLNGTTKITVDALEKISEYLSISPAYWWKDEFDGLLAGEPEMQYGIKAENEFLRKQLEEKERYISRLEKDLERLEHPEK